MTNKSIYEKLVVDLEELRMRISQKNDIESIIAEIKEVISICEYVPIKDAQKSIKLEQLRSEQRDADVKRLRQLISSMENGSYVLHSGIFTEISLLILGLISNITFFNETDINKIISDQKR